MIYRRQIFLTLKMIYMIDLQIIWFLFADCIQK